VPYITEQSLPMFGSLPLKRTPACGFSFGTCGPAQRQKPAKEGGQMWEERR